MVLQDTGAPPPESFSDNPNSSENDPWSSPAPSSDSTTKSKYSYDSSKFPQPVPVLGPLIGYSASTVRWRVDDTLKYAEKAMHRPLTHDEATALAGHLYVAEQQRSYFTAAGLGIGVWRWHATRQKNGYPFYTPKPEKVDPNKFLFLRDAFAQAGRSAFRFGVWAAFSMMGLSIIGSMYTSPTAARAAAEDPKLQALRKALQVRVQQRQPPYGTNPIDQSTPASSEEKLPPHAGAPRWGRTPSPAPRAPVQAGPGDDDMSPTAGNDPWPSPAESSWSSEPAQTQQPQTSYQVLQQRKQRQQPAADHDDVSPTGGMFQEETQANESAWERLRRGGASAQSSQQGEKSNLGDSWTFAESDEERKRAREKAQREFDARLERERLGKDFNDEKKW